MVKKNSRFTIFLFALLSLLPFFSAYAQSTGMLMHNPSDPVAGNPRGNVTIVEFFDYQCSHCISMAPVISDIISSNSNVRVVFKEFPIRGPMSELASRAALAANKQGKYYDFSHALLNDSGMLTEESIYKIAAEQGLNVAKLKKDMSSSSVSQQIAANYRLAKDLRLTGTPAFFIGPSNAQSIGDLNFVLGEMSQSQLQSAIANANK